MALANNSKASSPGALGTGDRSEKVPVEKTLFKRECVKFVPERENGMIRCRCGHSRSDHPDTAESGSRRPSGVGGEKWNPELNTVACLTDAYGTIEFQGGSHPSKAKFVRLAYDTSPDKILSLLLNSWKLQLPNLLISIQGGISNFDLLPKLQKAFRAGLLNAAKTTGAWIIASGTNTGVMKHVGDALGDTLMQSRNNIVTIGIAPWGIVQNNKSLIGMDHVIEYHAVPEPSSSSVLLSQNQSYFLLADNGTVGQFGSEILLRRRFEKYLSQQKFAHRSGSESCGIPVVCLVLEGGTNTIRTVLEYVTDQPPVPVVVCDGSGRAADLLAFAHKYSNSDGSLEEALCEKLRVTIEKVFQYTRIQAEKLLTELLLCVRNKQLMTVLKMGEENQELDLAILTSLIQGQNSSIVEKLGLVMSWDRADIARSHLFVYGQEWPKGVLDQAMMTALVTNRRDFVELLLENGVNMQKWLTISRLEELYNLALNQKVLPTLEVFTTSKYTQKQNSASTLHYLLQECKKDIPAGHRFHLTDIGQVINRLMGGVYKSEYSSKSFRLLSNASSKQGHSVGSIVAQVPVLITNISLHQGFRYPFSHLMVWAILLRRNKLAKFMWEHGEEAMAKALVAFKLYRRMAYEASQDELEADFVEELMQSSREFADLALELLEHCYQTDDDMTRQLLTYELTCWSSQTCLSLAASSEFQEFLAHSCCQILLSEMWMGGLIVRKYSTPKVIFGILFFPSILFLEYKTKEQLQLMPQTAQEHKNLMDRQSSRSAGSSDEDDDDDNDDDDEEKERRRRDVERRRGCHQEKANENAPVTKNSSGCSQLLSPVESNTLSRKVYGDQSVRTKIYEFYTAPVTKFWMYSISFVLFLLAFCYMVLTKSPPSPNWIEIYIILYVVGFGFDKIREFLMSEPVEISKKLSMFFNNWWNVVDVFSLIFFFIGVLLRIIPDYVLHARVFYGIAFMIFVIRIVDLFRVSKHLGPYVNMIWKMVKDLLKFVIMLLLVLMAFGIIRQSITYPNNDWDWDLVKEIFHKPYFMLYGEVYAGEIDPMCGNGTDPYYECSAGRWIVPASMSIFLIIGNILLLSLLIAVFNNTFNSISSITNQVWKFQRYFLVVEYESKPFLPPPLVLLSHILLSCKYVVNRFQGIQESFDHSLKLFLSLPEVENLHDFEEECMQSLSYQKKQNICNSDEKLLEVLAEKTEQALTRIDDLSIRKNSIRLYMQNMDMKLMKLQEIVLQSAYSVEQLQKLVGYESSGSVPPFTPASAASSGLPQKSALKSNRRERHSGVPFGNDTGVPKTKRSVATRCPDQSETCDDRQSAASDLSGIRGEDVAIERGSDSRLGNSAGPARNLRLNYCKSSGSKENNLESTLQSSNDVSNVNCLADLMVENYSGIDVGPVNGRGSRILPDSTASAAGVDSAEKPVDLEEVHLGLLTVCDSRGLGAIVSAPVQNALAADENVSSDEESNIESTHLLVSNRKSDDGNISHFPLQES